MHFKLIVAFVEDSKTDAVMDAARDVFEADNSVTGYLSRPAEELTQ